MKVLDLQCSHQHPFEGWFASEADFVVQCERGLVQCPVCADPHVVKKPSAPRLNLSGAREPQAIAAPDKSANKDDLNGALAAAWMAVGRQLIANTTDVGDQFAEEARKMHYGETEVRGIRGQTSPEQARELVEEGIEVIPFVLPDALKGPLQ